MGLLSPGPDFFYVSRTAAIHSRRTAIYGVIGITIGVTIWATAAVLGLAIVFKTMPALQGIVMALGGSYLFYLGVKMARVTTNAVFDESNLVQNTASKNEIIKGLLVNLSNAKVVIYFSSVMSFVLVNITETRQMLTALCFFLGIWLCERTSHDMGVHDHGSIVWDEIVAVFLVLLAVPEVSLFWCAVAFVTFRLFDILKPYPIRYFDEKLTNGFGIMVDDILAAGYSILVILALAHFI